MVKIDIESLRKDLTSAPPKERAMSARQIVASLINELRARQAQGDSLDDLVAWFASKGVNISKNSLSNYMSQAAKANGVNGRVTRRIAAGKTNANATQSAAQFSRPFQASSSVRGANSNGFVELRPDL